MLRRSLLVAPLFACLLAGRADAKPADDPSFRLVNRSGQDIVALFATPSGMANWGQNRLDRGPLPTGAARVFPIPRSGNCYFDLKVVFADRKALERHHTNLCRLTDLPVP